MKVEWNKKYTTIAVYALIVICIAIVFYNIVSQFHGFQLGINSVIRVFMPFVRGFALAYMLNFLLKFFEEKVFVHKKFREIKPALRRAVSLIATLLVLALVIYLMVVFVLPQLTASISGLVDKSSTYAKQATDFIESLKEKYPLPPEIQKILEEKLAGLKDRLLNLVQGLLPTLFSISQYLISSVINTILAFIISIYFLISKEQFFALWHKINTALFSEYISNKLLIYIRRVNDIFGKFISGKILDSLIVGVITFIAASIFRIPYAILISVLVGVTNVIPYFGPIIGGVPSVLLVLFDSPIKALTIAIIILVVQQLDGNIIGPKIMGASMGISAFSILFSLTIFTSMFGFMGMLIGVPLYAFLHSLAVEFIDWRLKRKGKPTDLAAYEEG